MSVYLSRYILIFWCSKSVYCILQLEKWYKCHFSWWNGPWKNCSVSIDAWFSTGIVSLFDYTCPCNVIIHALLFLAQNAQQIHGPFLVVVPLSTLSNWAKEFRKWLPDMNIIIYVGTRASREVRHFWVCL